MKLFEPLDAGIISGGKRCFKSLHLVRMMYAAYKNGWEVYTNMTLKFPSIKLDSNNGEIFIQQLRDIINDRSKRKHYSNAFLGIDEFQGISFSQNWRKGSESSQIWDMLGKIGFTTYVTTPNQNKVYNGFRDSANKRLICKRLTKNTYYVLMFKQSDIDYTEYNKIGTIALRGNEIYDLYDTHEVMYLESPQNINTIVTNITMPKRQIK